MSGHVPPAAAGSLVGATGPVAFSSAVRVAPPSKGRAALAFSASLLLTNALAGCVPLGELVDGDGGGMMGDARAESAANRGPDASADLRDASHGRDARSADDRIAVDAAVLDAGDDGAPSALFCASATPPHTFCDDWDEGNPVNFLWNGSQRIAHIADAGPLLYVDVETPSPSAPGSFENRAPAADAGLLEYAGLSQNTHLAPTNSARFAFAVRIDSDSTKGTRLAGLSLEASGVTVYGWTLVSGGDEGPEVQELVTDEAGHSTYSGTGLSGTIAPGVWTDVVATLNFATKTWSLTFQGRDAVPAQAMAATTWNPATVVVAYLGIAYVQAPFPALSYHFDNATLDLE